MPKIKTNSTMIDPEEDWKAKLQHYGCVVEDAKENLIVNVTEKDDAIGVGTNPGACTFFHAVKHSNNDVKEVMVGNNIAQVIVERKNGKAKCLRYSLPNVVRTLIKVKDNGGKIPAAKYLFLAPSGRNTLDAKKANQRARTKRWRKVSHAKKRALQRATAKRKAERAALGYPVSKAYHVNSFNRHFNGGSYA